MVLNLPRTTVTSGLYSKFIAALPKEATKDNRASYSSFVFEVFSKTLRHQR